MLGTKSSGRVNQCLSIKPMETVMIYSYWTSCPRYWLNFLFSSGNRDCLASAFHLLSLLLLHIKKFDSFNNKFYSIFSHYIIKFLKNIYWSALIYLCKIAAFFTFVSFFMVSKLNILFIGCSCAHHVYYFIMMEWDWCAVL